VYRDAATRPSDVAAVAALARTLHAWEQWSAAHETYARAQALAPEAFEWQYLDAIVLERLAQHAEAASHLEIAVQLSPSYLPARVKLAEAVLESGNLERCAQLFEALRSERTAEPAAEFGLGRAAAAQGRHEVAVTHLQRAVTLFPEWGAAHYALALSYRSLGRRDDARRELELHARYGPRWPGIDDPVLAAVTALRDDESTALQRGLKLAETGDVAGAIAAHEAALARDPSIAQAHANLISLYGQQRNWAKAEEHYRAVVALGVNLADAHNDYGGVLALQQKWELAADTYRKAIAVNPAFRLARFNLGRMLIALGKNEDAIQELDQLKQPRDAEAPRYLFALATAYVRAGRKDEGIKWANDAKALAIEHGQRELAEAIDRELARLK
jgi:tetratricopeptide (TPR) repeat protein